MLKSIIIDDEKDAAVNLISLLSGLCPEVDIMACADSVQGGIEVINNIKPDVVFLDVLMEDGLGFDVLEQVGKVDFSVIFITAFDDYAIQAIKYSALDYLLKPINPMELKEAVEKVKERKNIMEYRHQLETLRYNLSIGELKKIQLPSYDGFHLVDVGDIVRCESDKNYTTFYFLDGSNIIVSKSLKEYEKILPGSLFFRVHQSHLINLEYITFFNRKESFLALKDGSRVEVSRRRKLELLKMLA